MRKVVACSFGAARLTNKTLITLVAIAALAVSSAAMARGGGGGGGSHGASGGGHSAHGSFGGHFGNKFGRHFDHRFRRNRVLFGFGGGWDGWGGGPYGEGGNTTVVNFPSAIPQAADVTGSTAAPCHWNEETFKVPSSTGATEPISIVSCR